MIIARLNRAIRDQNWFAAGVEIVIVILGVVIGLQITAWYENRAERVREAGYLLQLERELGVIVEEGRKLQQEIDFYHRSTVAFTEGLQAGDRTAAQENVWGPVAIGQIVTVHLQPAALTELLNSGELRILQNGALRGALAAVPQEQLNLQTRLEQIMLAQATYADEVPLRFQVRHEDWPDRVAPDMWSFDFDAVVEDATFLSRLNNAAYQNRVMLGYIDRAIADLDGLRRQVGDEIEARGMRPDGE